MTFWELIRALVRYWPIVLAGAVITAAAGIVAISRDGVYYTRATIIFLAPPGTLYPNVLRTQLDDVISTAGLVAKRVSGPGRLSKFATPGVTLVGLGVRDGWSLRLPDTGGQWASNFATQTLALEVVGPSQELVRAREDELVARVQQELLKLQRDARVHRGAHITARRAPESSVIYYVGGNRPRVLGMTALLGIGLTGAAVLAVDRHRRRREAARQLLDAAQRRLVPR